MAPGDMGSNQRRRGQRATSAYKGRVEDGKEAERQAEVGGETNGKKGEGKGEGGGGVCWVSAGG